MATFSVSCGGDDDEKSDREVQIDKLVGTWNATEVLFEGSTPPLDHSKFQLVITKDGKTRAKYEALGRPQGPSAWPASGSFEFGSNAKTNLIRDDQTNIQYSVTDTELTMSFTFTGEPYAASGGRAKNVEGGWDFKFTKVQ